MKHAVRCSFCECTNVASTLSHQQLLKEQESWPHLLFIQSTPTVGESAMVLQDFCDVRVESVCQEARDSFPQHDENYNHCSVTGVAYTLPHQTQQLLLLAASANHLCGFRSDPDTPARPKENKGHLQQITTVYITTSRVTFTGTCNWLPLPIYAVGAFIGFCKEAKAILKIQQILGNNKSNLLDLSLIKQMQDSAQGFLKQ